MRFASCGTSFQPKSIFSGDFQKAPHFWRAPYRPNAMGEKRRRKACRTLGSNSTYFSFFGSLLEVL
ncbi:MAG: hypothetical protein DMG35_02160 [Acidobacteria bacterium]|nr:MAG: hypothetical protein AUH86_21050 [Acidobacteria bacterium 13_1_40CM_4_58_4]PYT63962.1 MAG: hypothetical protein DMG35_02160 [Acidobacteriota bacterium]